MADLIMGVIWSLICFGIGYIGACHALKISGNLNWGIQQRNVCDQCGYIYSRYESGCDNRMPMCCPVCDKLNPRTGHLLPDHISPQCSRIVLVKGYEKRHVNFNNGSVVQMYRDKIKHCTEHIKCRHEFISTHNECDASTCKYASRYKDLEKQLKEAHERNRYLWDEQRRVFLTAKEYKDKVRG